MLPQEKCSLSYNIQEGFHMKKKRKKCLEAVDTLCHVYGGKECRAGWDAL